MFVLEIKHSPYTESMYADFNVQDMFSERKKDPQDIWPIFIPCWVDKPLTQFSVCGAVPVFSCYIYSFFFTLG